VLLVLGLLLAAGLAWLIAEGIRPPEPGTSTTRERDDRPTGGPDETSDRSPAASAVISGVVQGPDGSPYAGARVTLLGLESDRADAPAVSPLHPRIEEALSYAADMFERPLRLRTAAPETAPKHVARATSDAGGRFGFPVVLGLRYRLEASAEGLFAGPTQALRAGDRAILRLSAGAVLAGMVSSRDDGKPLSGVRVSARTSTGVPADTTTGADGSFALGGLAPGALTVDLNKEGFATRVVTLRLPEEGLTRTFRMSCGVTVTAVVEVTDENDEDHPAVGAEVAFVESGSGLVYRAKTGADGKAVLEHLPPGVYDAAAHMDGAIPDVEWRLRLTTDREVAFYLEREVRSTIRVLGPDGAPVAGAKFLLANADEEIDVRTSREVGRSDENGLFRFAFDEDARAVLWVTAPGLAAAFVEPDDPTESEEITVILRRGVALTGRVVDEERRPIAGAVVYVESMHDDLDDEVIATVITGEDGTFRVEHLLRGEVDIEVSAEGYLPTDDDVEQLMPDAPPVEIVLRRGHEVRGRIVDAGGAPVPGVLVAAPGASGDKATSDVDGTFRIGALHPRAAASGFRLRLDHSGLVWSRQVTAGDQIVVVVPASAAVEGRVVSGDGNEPVREFTIEVRSPESGLLLRNPVTDLEGRFSILVPEIPGAEIHVRARTRSEWSRPLAGIPPAERANLTVLLETPPRISIRVLTESGAPVLGARILVRGIRERWSRQAVSGTGGVALVEGRAGEVVIEVAHRSHTGVRTEPVLIEAGRETVREVRLPAASAARVRVSGPGGPLILPGLRFSPRAVVGGTRERCTVGARTDHGVLTIEFEGPGATVLKSIRPRVDGNALVVQGLPAGSYRARAMLGSNRGAPVTFVITAGSTVPVELVVGR
jgi:hypothetical protein